MHVAGEPAALGTIKPSRGPCLRTTNRIQCGHAFANIRKFFRGPSFQPPGKPRGVFSCSNCFASDLCPSEILFRRRLREVGSVFDRIMRTCIYIYGINAISWAKLRFRREEQFRTIVCCSKIESEKRLNWFSFRIGDFVWRMFEVIEYSLISLNCCWNLIKEIIFFIIIIIVFSFYIFHSMWKENTVFFSRNSILFPVFLNINNLIAFPFSNCRSI